MINHISIQSIWSMSWLQITQKHNSVMYQMEWEGNGESSYRFGRPVLHSHWCYLATRNTNCWLSLQGNKQVMEQEAKTNGRETLNIDWDIKCRELYFFEKVDQEIFLHIMWLLISSLSHSSCSRILGDRRKKCHGDRLGKLRGKWF